jgi:hypothetical protein
MCWYRHGAVVPAAGVRPRIPSHPAALPLIVGTSTAAGVVVIRC